MSEGESGQQGPFDLARLRELVELMELHGLTEVNLKRGDEQWRLRRGPQEMVQMTPASGYAAPAAAPPPAASAAPAETPSAGKESDSAIYIKSPTVGTFYAAPSPDDPPFVTVGSTVKPESIVCIVEAMKVFNQIPAEVGGTIAEILVNNGDPVDFGQPLFRVTA